MSDLETVRRFYSEQVPQQFNETLAKQREEAHRDADAARVLEEMEAVRASIVVRVEHPLGMDAFSFDIERGEMACVDRPAHAPFLILGHSAGDAENLRRECGDSLLGFLGGLAGLGDEMRLTSLRVRSLRELDGGLVFERTGAGGFALFAFFGAGAGSGEGSAAPRATIRIDEATYARLRSGALDPQDAFLDQAIEVEGDEAMAIGLALAALSPE